MNLKQVIENSENLDELHELNILPEPYDDRGYFFIYYAEADYKQALGDVVEFIDGGMRIYYDRMLEHGTAWRNDYIVKCKSLHCRCVVFYLSEHVFADETFFMLCDTVYRNHIPHISVNMPSKNGILSGAQMLENSAYGFTDEQRYILGKLFSSEITYIPYSFSVKEKRFSLEKAHSKPTFAYSVNGDFAVINRLKDITAEEITVPEKVLIGDSEYTVKAIAPSAFSGCENLTRIYLPPTIETIGIGKNNGDSGRVFENCIKLEEIIFPDSVKLLATGCFAGCTSLNRLILNDDLNFKGNNFYDLFNFDFYENNCEESDEFTLSELKLPKCVRKISKDKYIVLFESALLRFTPPAARKIWGYTYDSIGSEYYVSPNTDVSFLRGLDEIENVTFDPEWKGMNLSDCFTDCINLKTVKLPEICTSLDGTFEGCTALEKLILPKTLILIGAHTFAQCAALKELTIPENVTKIENDAFEGCANLKTLTIENANGKKLFKGGIHLTRNEALYIKDKIENILGAIKLPFFILFHLKTFIELCRREPFYINSSIEELYVKRKCRIKKFKLISSDREGYFRYVRKNLTLQ